MVLDGEHSCDKCNEKFNWFYVMPDEEQQTPFDEEEPPKGCQKIFYINKVDDEKNPVGGVAKCPKCNNETLVNFK